MPLILTAEQKKRIEAEGAAAYPNECCGIMIGRDVSDGTCTRRVVERLEAMANVFDAAQQRRRFAVDPVALMRAERSAAAEGMLVVGFYHSHPDHPARPSEYDREHGWPFYSYVIVAVAQGVAGEMTSWVLDERTETFDKQDIEST